jgi:putative peptidoglycan lipid II flippase
MSRLNKEGTVKTYSFIILCVVLSKAMGLLRDMCLAAFYGTGSMAAAFATASRIPLLFFDITLGTAVASAFIPVFNRYLAREDKEKAYAFANLFITTAGLISVGIAALLLAFPQAAVGLMAPGFDKETAYLAAKLLQIMSPIVVIAVLCYSLVGFLQSMGEFNRPAIMSLLSNLVLLIYYFTFNKTLGILGLGAALVVGWFLQLWILLGPLKRYGFSIKPRLNFSDEGLKAVLILSVPVLISSWTQPINTLISNNLASSINGARSVMLVGYGYQLYFMIAGVFSLGMTNLFFPKMSRHFAAGEKEEEAKILFGMLSAVTLIVLPVMAFLGIFAQDVVRLVYERKSFLPADTVDTALVLSVYVLGMLGLSWQEILNKYFYSSHNSKTPMVVAVGTIGINVVLSIVFSRYYKEAGIALASTISVIFMGGTLFVLSLRRNKGMDLSAFVKDILKGLLAAAAGAVFMAALNRALPDFEGFVFSALRLGLSFLGGTVVYLGILILVKADCVKKLMGQLGKNR